MSHLSSINSMLAKGRRRSADLDKQNAALKAATAGETPKATTPTIPRRGSTGITPAKRGPLSSESNLSRVFSLGDLRQSTLAEGDYRRSASMTDLSEAGLTPRASWTDALFNTFGLARSSSTSSLD